MPEAVLYRPGKPVYAGGPATQIYVDTEGGSGRRPYEVYMGSPAEREARR